MKYLLCIFLFASSIARAETTNESEAGLVLNHGNSKSQSVNAKHLTQQKWSANTVSGSGSYMRSKSGGLVSAERWDLLAKYERELSGSFSMIAAQGVEGDRFAGYRQRYNTDIGPKYYFHKEDKVWEWFGELGYRYTRENTVANERKKYHKARLYTESNWAWSQSGSSKIWIEYLPNFTDSSDWLLNAEISSSAAFTNILAFKVAYLVKFDNKPNLGIKKKTDGTLTTSLVAKF